jgi:hypothetical protein
MLDHFKVAHLREAHALPKTGGHFWETLLRGTARRRREFVVIPEAVCAYPGSQRAPAFVTIPDSEPRGFRDDGIRLRGPAPRRELPLWPPPETSG